MNTNKEEILKTKNKYAALENHSKGLSNAEPKEATEQQEKAKTSQSRTQVITDSSKKSAPPTYGKGILPIVIPDSSKWCGSNN